AKLVELGQDFLFRGPVDRAPLAPALLGVAERNRADPLAVVALEHGPLAAPAPRPPLLRPLAFRPHGRTTDPVMPVYRPILTTISLAAHRFPLAPLDSLIHERTVSGSDSSSLAITSTVTPSEDSWRARCCRSRYALVRHAGEQ